MFPWDAVVMAVVLTLICLFPVLVSFHLRLNDLERGERK